MHGAELTSWHMSSVAALYSVLENKSFRPKTSQTERATCRDDVSRRRVSGTRSWTRDEPMTNDEPATTAVQVLAVVARKYLMAGWASGEGPQAWVAWWYRDGDACTTTIGSMDGKFYHKPGHSEFSSVHACT